MLIKQAAALTLEINVRGHCWTFDPSQVLELMIGSVCVCVCLPYVLVNVGHLLKGQVSV